MATFKKYKTRKNGLTSYRQEGAHVSIFLTPGSFTNGELPESFELDAPNLAAPTAKVKRSRMVDPALIAARQLLADAKAARKAALAARLEAMTPEQKVKREQALEKARVRAKAKAATVAA